MDLKKILLAFLYLFLILDVILAYQLYLVLKAPTDPLARPNVMQEMKYDGIKLGRIDTEPQHGAYLSGKDGGDYLEEHSQGLKKNWKVRMEDEILFANARQPIPMGKTKKDAIHKLKQWVKKSGQVIDGQDYMYDDKQSQYADDHDVADVHVIVFTQRVRGNESFTSSRAKIQITLDRNYSIVRYTQTMVQDIQILRTVPTLLSEEQALMKAYQYNEIPNNSKINWGKLGYSTLMEVRSDRVYIPIWTFSITESDGDTAIVYINALNGALMR